MRNRSTVCTHAKRSAIWRVLFACSLPTKCHVSRQICERVDLRQRFLHVTFAEVFETHTVRGSDRSYGGCCLLTATIVTLDFARLARCVARATRSTISARYSVISVTLCQ